MGMRKGAVYECYKTIKQSKLLHYRYIYEKCFIISDNQTIHKHIKLLTYSIANTVSPCQYIVLPILPMRSVVNFT
ncbi:hypothetical protein Hanom_Chr14g01304601 [Helianthus anomalus]